LNKIYRLSELKMIRPGLQRVTRLMAETPMPWKAIHVSGTNGKGSIVNSISAMLKIYNDSDWRKKVGQPLLRHGQFTSPHLLHRWDGISIQGETISKADFLRIEQHVRTRNDDLSIEASEFEQLTAAAFTAFTESELDVAVVEVGMGGLEDATNIIGQDLDVEFDPPKKYTLSNRIDVTCHNMREFRPLPLVTAIANVGFDHQEYLGGKLQEIAKHKAGIIKPEAWVATAKGNHPLVYQAVKHAMEENNAKDASWFSLFPQLQGYTHPRKGVSNHNINMARANWLDKKQNKRFSDVPMRLRAEWRKAPTHVWRNTSVALRSVWGALTTLNLVPDKHSPQLQTIEHSFLWNMFEDMLEAPLETVVPGRQEIISLEKISGSDRHVLLDGAHNREAAKALADTVQRLPGRQIGPIMGVANPPIDWIIGFSSTKDVSSILKPLIHPRDTVHIVQFATPIDGMPWVQPMPSEPIIQMLRDHFGNKHATKIIDWGQDVWGALKATSRMPRQNSIVITGSLYLVSEVKRLLQEANENAASSDLPPAQLATSPTAQDP
jgi:folylpolyglutamate synthase